MATTIRITDKDRGMGDALKVLRALGRRRIRVGYHSKKHPTGPEVASIAAAHEFGAPAHNLPPRPTLTPVFEDGKKRHVERLTSLLAGAIADKVMKTPSDTGPLHVFGSEVVAEVKRKITDLRDPPLAQATIDRKGSSNPLIDTGAMRDAVEHRVL